MPNDAWDEEAMRLIHEASELIKPGEGEAVFYIRVGGPYTQCTVKAAAGVDPAKVIHAAIDVLNKEFADLKNCPVHTPQPSELEARLVKTTHELVDAEIARDAALAQIAKLQADGDKLAGALERSRQGWSNVLELGLLPVQHQSTALGLQEAATQALTEWKDRA